MRWPSVGDKCRSRAGAEYVVESVSDSRFRIKRPGTGSLVTVTRAKCEKAMALPRPIAFRSIDGTSAIETGVAFACGFIATDSGWDGEAASHGRVVGDAVLVLFDFAWGKLPLHVKEGLLEGIIECMNDDGWTTHTGEGGRETLVEDAKESWMENAYEGGSGDITVWVSTLSSALEALEDALFGGGQ